MFVIELRIVFVILSTSESNLIAIHSILVFVLCYKLCHSYTTQMHVFNNDEWLHKAHIQYVNPPHFRVHKARIGRNMWCFNVVILHMSREIQLVEVLGCLGIGFPLRILIHWHGTHFPYQKDFAKEKLNNEWFGSWQKWSLPWRMALECKLVIAQLSWKDKTSWRSLLLFVCMQPLFIYEASKCYGD